MSFTEAISTCFSKYVTFSGRARRSEYWYFILFTFLVNTGLRIVGLFVPVGILLNLVSLVFVLPTMAVFWRRMHDTGRSGLWWFAFPGVILLFSILMVITVALGGTRFMTVVMGIYLIAFFAVLIVRFVFLATDSDMGDNKYGPCPK